MRKPNPNPNATRRSAARLAAVQALYSMELTGISAQDALDALAQHQRDNTEEILAEPNADLVTFLVLGASAQQESLDQDIALALHRDWTIERLEAILRAILRVGAYELRNREKTPARVAISEYVDVAHAFYAGPEPGLVNAVMDKMARVVRPLEFKKAEDEGGDTATSP